MYFFSIDTIYFLCRNRFPAQGNRKGFTDKETLSSNMHCSQLCFHRVYTGNHIPFWKQRGKSKTKKACHDSLPSGIDSYLFYAETIFYCHRIRQTGISASGRPYFPDADFPFGSDPVFVLFCTCVNSRCNRIFLFPLVFTLCYFCPLVTHCRLCASLSYAFPGSYSVVPRCGTLPL